MTKKIAVIGAGIFGITTALKLSPYYQVDLYEKRDDILKAASGINQFRLHRGYHYPRSPRTILGAIEGEPSFRQMYGQAIIDDSDNYYCIAKHNSLTNPKDYLNILKKYKLEYSKTDLDILNKEFIELCLKVQESLIDPLKLRQIAKKKLIKSSVRLLLNKKADSKIFKKYDQVIICTYSNLNQNLKLHPDKQEEYQYELCEKIVVKLPKDFKNKSVVILDGPFMCFDPYGRTGLFLLGNVVHAIHNRHVSKHPKLFRSFSSLLNNGIIKNPTITNFKKFIESAEPFIPKIKYAKHIGSMYTFRTVLPNKDKTDERPTVVRTIDDQVLTVFSGKIVNCVDAAEEVLRKIKGH